MQVRDSHVGRNEILYGAASLVVIVIAIGAYFFVDNTTNDETYRRLIQRAQSLAIMLDPDELATLTLSESDLENPVYQRLKERLTEVREKNVQSH